MIDIPQDIFYSIIVNGGFELMMTDKRLNNFKNDKIVIEQMKASLNNYELIVKYIENALELHFKPKNKWLIRIRKSYLWYHFSGNGLDFTDMLRSIDEPIYNHCLNWLLGYFVESDLGLDRNYMLYTLRGDAFEYVMYFVEEMEGYQILMKDH